MVCIDTMGQDWQLTAEQIDFALKTVKNYSHAWSDLEKRNLWNDIHRWDWMAIEEKDLIDPEDAPSNRFDDEENQFINDFFAEQNDPENPMDDETRSHHVPVLRWQWITNKISSDEFKKALYAFKHFKVVKY